MQKINLMMKAKSFYTKITMLLFTFVYSAVAFAQDTKKVDVDISTGSEGGGGGFFASPWVWVVGVAVFILLLVALMRGGGNRRSDV